MRNWSTGEICNNGTYEIDIACWALGVDFPICVTSAGGRYHDDDWEFCDTQVVGYDFDRKTVGLARTQFQRPSRAKPRTWHQHPWN